MSSKKLLVLLVVLGILVFFGVLKKINTVREEAQKEKAAESSVVVLLKDLATASVARIETYTGTDTENKFVLAKKEGDRWIVESHYNHPAKKYPIDNILKSVPSIQGELRSDSKDVLSDFKLKDDEAHHLVLYTKDNTALAHLLISPLRVKHNQNFLRLASSDEVLSTLNTDILSHLGIWAKDDSLSEKTFVDLQVLKYETSKVDRVEFMPAMGGSKIVMAKHESADAKTITWSFEPEDKTAEIENSKVNELLSNLSNLYGQEVVNPKGDYGFAEASPWIALVIGKEKDSVRNEIFLGKRDEVKKSHYVLVKPSGFVHLVGDASIDLIKKKDKQSFLKQTSAKT